LIRVNLLPQKRESKRGGLTLGTGDGGQAWMLVVLGVLLLEIVVLIVFQRRKQDELDVITKKNNQITANIDDIKRQMANHADIKNQLKDLRDREEAIAKLESARTGPTAVMLELSHVLTSGRGPTTDRDKLEQLKRDNPTQVPNPNWDPRRLWLLTYSEVDRTVKLSGLARDGEDVAELLKRLTLSDYFYELRVLPAAKQNDSVSHLELMKFELSAKVRY
jgi:type IV pilus assembly protein PilN